MTCHLFAFSPSGFYLSNFFSPFQSKCLTSGCRLLFSKAYSLAKIQYICMRATATTSLFHLSPPLSSILSEIHFTALNCERCGFYLTKEKHLVFVSLILGNDQVALAKI